MDSSKAAYKWDKENTTGVYLKLQNRTDGDILELFARIVNRQGYIKRLIRSDLEKPDGEKIFVDFLK